MAETKKNANSKKKPNAKKNNNVKKDNKKAVEKVKEVKKVTEKKVEEKVKKEPGFIKTHLTDIILIAVAVIVVIVGIIAVSKNSADEEKGYLVELNYKQYTEKQESGETFPVVIESATCGHCQNFMPVVKRVANKNEVYVYYIDLDKLSQDEYTGLVASNNFFEKNEDWGTPSTIVLTGKDASDSLIGETDESTLKEFLQKNKLMG